MIRLVQLEHPTRGRAIATAGEATLDVVQGFATAYALMQAVLRDGGMIAERLANANVTEQVSYDAVYRGESDWSLLPTFDHPDDQARCMVSGTGLTHLGSARQRQAMHASDSNGADDPKRSDEPVTDSMRMFQAGVGGGKPAPGQIGATPEWFYKGDGSILRAHNQPLTVPAFAGDGGEEAEVAGVYVIDHNGRPRRVGFTPGNEFSDHVTEKRNYLLLAPSKLRECAIGPELIIDAPFDDIRGRVTIERGDDVIWSHEVATGETNMCHSLMNLEHHHFKQPGHRRPGDVHVHFFGADTLSFGHGVSLVDGDVMVVE